MKGKLDLIISDPPLAPLMIDHYQKKKEKTRKKPIGRVDFCLGTEGIHRPIKKSPQKEKENYSFPLWPLCDGDD